MDGTADMPRAERELLREELFRRLHAPERELKHHWRKGDLVIWDKLALQPVGPNFKAEGPGTLAIKMSIGEEATDEA
jgi:taurine dioxygenase